MNDNAILTQEEIEALRQIVNEIREEEFEVDTRSADLFAKNNSQDSIKAMNRLAGEPMEIFLNGILVAHGEIVLINDKFGVRLTEIVRKDLLSKNNRL